MRPDQFEQASGSPEGQGWEIPQVVKRIEAMDSEEERTLGVTDYIIFISTLVACAAVGIYFRFTGKKQSTVSEVVVGDRNMPVVPVAFSIMATFCSAIGIVGVAAECYIVGLQMLYHIIGFYLGVIICMYLYHPVFYEMKIVTVNEYLEKRFGIATRKFASANFILLAMFLSGFGMYAAALAVTAMTNISFWTSVVVGSLICIFYCVLGGIKAVIWIDTLQALIMFVTLISIVTKGLLDLGGFTNMWKVIQEGGRTEQISFSLSPTLPYTFWNILFGHTTKILFYYGVNQAQVQRVVSCRSLKQSKMAVLLGVTLTVVIFLLNALVGYALFATFGTCDGAEETKRLKSADQLFPYFAMTRLHSIPGLPGIVVAGLLSSALSTISSLLNSLSAVTLEDFIKPIYAGELSEKKSVFIIKFLTFVYGGLTMFCTFLVEKMGTIFKALSTVVGATAGTSLGIYTLGMLFQRPNQKGAIASFIVTEVICIWLAIGKTMYSPSGSGLYSPEHCYPENSTSWPANFTNNRIVYESLNSTETRNNRYVFPLYKLSHMLFCVLAFLLSMFIGYIISLLTGLNQSIPPQLLSPLVRLPSERSHSPKEKQVEMVTKGMEFNTKQEWTKF